MDATARAIQGRKDRRMSDTISRQDAIDALMNDSDWADAIPTIKSLPSAETPTVLEKHQLSEETPTNTSTDLISRKKLFNKLATVQAPPEANEYKAEVYKIIQSMGTEENDEQ